MIQTMNHILKNISLIFNNLGIFQDLNLKLNSSNKIYEEIEVEINKNNFYIKKWVYSGLTLFIK